MLTDYRKGFSILWHALENKRGATNNNSESMITLNEKFPDDIFDGYEAEIKGKGKDQLILSLSKVDKIVTIIQGSKFSQAFEAMGLRNPQITYLTFYRTHHIPSNKSVVYANHWHFDTTVRVGCVKLFFCPEKLSEKDGPMEYLSAEQSKKFEIEGFSRGPELPRKAKINKFYGNERQILLLKPFQCLHRAGIPERDHSRLMLMLQINDRKAESTPQKIYESQFLDREPTLKHEMLDIISFKKMFSGLKYIR